MNQPAAQAGLAATIEHRVLAARVRMLYDTNLSSALSIVPFAALVCWLLWPVAEHGTLLAWMASKVVASAVLLAADRAYRRAGEVTNPRRWGDVYVGLLALDGLTWSAMAIALPPPGRDDLAAVMFAAVVGVGAVGALSLSALFAGIATFSASLLAPVILWHFSRGTATSLFAGTGATLFLGLILLNCHKTSHSLWTMLRLQFQLDDVADQRAAALDLAERHSRVKSQFLATMSHEMRTPLHGMLGTLRLIREQRDPDQAARQIDLVEQSGKHLLRLINDVLDFSRIEAGRLEVVEAPYDIACVLHDVVDLCAGSAEGRPIRVRADIPLRTPTWVMGDGARVRQVVMNLVGNAIKFTDHGQVELAVRIEHSTIHIAVHDTGIGISPEDLPHIFDAFRQADGSFSRRFEGTGLGLTISRELTRAMGGDLSCTSRLEEGSTFTLHLPWRPCPAPAATAAAPAAADRPRLTGRALLADDNPVNVLVARSMAERLGLSVTVVTDGAQAVAAYLQDRPDVVLMDCHMPVMDGFEATRRIREAEQAHGWPRVPIVAVTANAFEEDHRRCIEAGMDGHLAKPFTLDELRTRIVGSIRGAPAGTTRSIASNT